MVQSAKEALQQTNFDYVFSKVVCFVNDVNGVLSESNVDAAVSTELTSRRVSKKKRMPDEQSIDCRPEDPLQRMKVEVFRRVIDQITTSIDERFSVNHPLIRDTACLDPRRFKEIVSDGIPRGSLDFIAKCITLSVTDLQDELVSFAREFESLSRTLRQEFQDVQTTDQLASSIESESDTASGSECEKSDPSDTDEEACDLLVRNKVACTGCCRTCLLCCYRILYKYSLNDTTYSNLFQAYEYLLTYIIYTNKLRESIQ